MNLEDVLLQGTRAAQPVASAVAEGSLYYVTDEGVLEQSLASAWTEYSDPTPGGGITQLTGDVTAGPGTGSVAATIANDAVTDAKLRESGALSVIGRSANSTGNPADIAASAASGAVLRESGSTLGFGTIVAAGIASDAVITAKILDANVTLAKLADLVADRLIGRGNGGGTGVPQEITLGTGLSMTGTTLNAASSTPGWTLLATRTASASASLDFTSLITSTYNTYAIEVESIIPANDNVSFIMRCSTNNGSSYDSGSSYAYSIGYADQASSSGGSGSASASQIVVAGPLSNVATRGGASGMMYFHNPLFASGRKMLTSQIANAHSNTNFYIYNMAAWYTPTTAVNAIQFLMDGGNIASGVVRLYGIIK